MKTLSSIALPTLLSLAAFLAAPSPAAARPAHCEVTINGYVYMNGTCEFSTRRGGSFDISGQGYFARVNPQGNGMAYGYIADEMGSRRVMNELGQLERDGACWTSDYARICAWSL